MKKISSEHVQTAAYEIGDLTYQIDFIVGYLSLLSCNVNDKEGRDKATILYASLIHDKGLRNLTRMLETLKDKVNNTSNLLLDIHGIMEEGGEND